MVNEACKQQTYFRLSLFSLRKSYFLEGEKQRLEMYLLFALRLL